MKFEKCLKSIELKLQPGGDEDEDEDAGDDGNGENQSGEGLN